MSNLSTRIYFELGEWKYNEIILTNFLRAEKKKQSWANAILIIISIIGVAGWLRHEEYKLIWSVILMLSICVRILHNYLFTTTNDLFNIKNSIAFYNYHLLDLENLFFDLYNEIYIESSVEQKFNKLRDDERNLFGKQTFEKLSPNNKLMESSELETDKYLEKIKRMINNE